MNGFLTYGHTYTDNEIRTNSSSPKGHRVCRNEGKSLLRRIELLRRIFCILWAFGKGHRILSIDWVLLDICDKLLYPLWAVFKSTTKLLLHDLFLKAKHHVCRYTAAIMTLIMCLGNRQVWEAHPRFTTSPLGLNKWCLFINLSDTCWGTMLRHDPLNYLRGFQEGLTPLKRYFHQQSGVNFWVIYFLAFLLIQPPLPSARVFFFFCW